MAMCDCGDYDRPAVFQEVTRRAARWHSCGECRALIGPGQHYWESRGLWDGSWSTHRTCGACHLIGSQLADCYPFQGLAECLAEDLEDPDAAIAHAGMRRRLAAAGGDG